MGYIFHLPRHKLILLKWTITYLCIGSLNKNILESYNALIEVFTSTNILISLLYVRNLDHDNKFTSCTINSSYRDELYGQNTLLDML